MVKKQQDDPASNLLCRMTFASHKLLTLLVISLLTLNRSEAEEPSLFFQADIQPVLAVKCGKCHSMKVQKGGLDLSTIGSVRRGGESGDSVIGKSLEDSLLWTMIEGGDMPPQGQPPVTDGERDVLRRWINSGAKAESPTTIEPKQITQHDVLPILLLRCATCHGARVKQGGVDLRTPTAMLAGGKNGPAMLPGDPDSSLMIQRIESEACPPRELLLKFFVKRPSNSEVLVLRDWINAGAPEVDVVPDIATTEPDPLVTDEDRQHWAFQPLNSNSGTHSIDSFLSAKLSEKGLAFSPEADRDTLIRRAYIDLVGMLPSLEDWHRWHHSTDANWYGEMIDHLLTSPHYGERWGRYWLDLAGYADSEGGVSDDPVREVAWKYRDYVVRAFNEDKGYDRFLLEQLAGDELIDYEHAEVITQEMVDNLIATGFLRMGIDQTGSRTMNFVPERLGVISDAITIVGEGLMGLTLGCARCHSHKYDPIPHRDYYRFKAIFQGALDEHDWLTFRNRSLNVDVPERKKRVAEVNPPLAAQLKRLESSLKKAETELQLDLLRHHYPDQSQADRDETLTALRIADNNRSQPQRILVEMLQRVEVLHNEQQPESVLTRYKAMDDLRNEIRQVRRSMEPSLSIRALWDRGDPSPTYTLRRGEHNNPGQLVGPGVPSALTDGTTPFQVEPPFPGGTTKSGRRLAFARWITAPDHPLTARVMVNRIWYHHFGAGIVPTLENFGVKGEPPSHPELLDWFATQFVNRGWSIKAMHRLIMNSQAYRQTSRVSEISQNLDPQNRFLSRMSLRRLNAEALRDSLLAVSNRLDSATGGPPDPVVVDRDGLVSVVPTASGNWRRSIYLQYRRTEIPTMMDTFDYPEMGPNCLSRSVSTGSPQSLLMMNNEHVHGLASAFAARVAQITTEHEDKSADRQASRNAQVITVYQLALSRLPTDEEKRIGATILHELADQWQGDSQKALETYCHTILNSAGFMFVD